MTDSLNCHRFIILSIRQPQHVIICFTETAHQTQNILRWSPQLYPGCAVHVIKPRVQFFVEDIPIIVLDEPLIHSELQPLCCNNIPPAVHISKADFGGFEFVFKSVRLISAVPVDAFCSDSFWTHNPS